MQARVLIADDDAVSRRLVAAHLIRRGYQIVTVKDGKAALEVLSGGGIDACVLDWEMPHMTGPQLCKWIRGAHLLPDPCVIILTSKDSSEEARAVSEAGANGYLIKPFNPDELESKLSSGIQRSRHRKPPKRS